MSEHFPAFACIVAKSFQDIMKESEVFVVDRDKDALWGKYLAAFPEGTDPLFEKETWHTCSCCRQFVRHAGGVVAIKNGVLHTVWDRAAQDAPEHYAIVAARLAEDVRSADIGGIFRVGLKETQFGASSTLSLDKTTGKAVRWEHLYTDPIPERFRVASPDAARGDYRTTVQVFERGLRELSPDAVSTVLSLIEGNAIYRGEEHKRAVVEFQKMQHRRAVEETTTADRCSTNFFWEHASSPAARFRNTVIGTLVQDLSEGVELERAVKSFETKVAPQNYKRTTALITPGMVKKAMETISELGLEPALERRFATITDVSVTDVLWVDGAAKSLMKGGIGDVLMQHAGVAQASAKDDDRVEDIALEEFVEKVLPQAQSVELFFAGRHQGNLMALTAPVHPEPAQLFRWGNDFAWSYSGNITDSIKERVKAAGGKIDGHLRVSLSWFNLDDLDLHIHEPHGGARSAYAEICYHNKRGWTGGVLDVDMNAGGGRTREPVENIVWATKPPDGAYRIVVNNYSQRETSDPGFMIEVECGGKVTHYSYNKQVRGGQDIHVATLIMKNGAIQSVMAGDPSVTSAAISQKKWGLTTERYVKVQTVMLSPNYWKSAGAHGVGNKHTFFVLEGAKSDEDMRGIYNEFLHPRLEAHRKVFEVIGDKTKCRVTEGHLAGLGFSSTKPDELRARVQQGKRQRIFNIYVGI